MNPAQATTKPPTATAAAARRMALSAVTKGRTEKPRRLLVYGTPGVGKSTFACAAPGAVVLPAEDGTAHLDVARFPLVESWRDVLDAVQSLIAGEHSYQTLVIDTLDGIEPLIFAEVCREAGKRTLEEVGGGYGKGYTAALDKWRELLARLEQLRSARGMAVVLVAHAAIRRFQNPEGEGYDRYQPKLHDKAAGLIVEWADDVLFAQHEAFTTTAKDGTTRGVSTGARVLHTERRAAFDAKNRSDLPETLPLDWARYAELTQLRQPAAAAELRRDIAAALEALPEDVRAKAQAWLATTGDDAAELARGLDRLRARLLTQQTQQTQH